MNVTPDKTTPTGRTWAKLIADAKARDEIKAKFTPSLPPDTNVIRFTLDVPALGKPRMTQQDKWKKRPCVVAYRAFADLLRAAAPKLPDAGDVASINVMAVYQPPPSWSLKQQKAALGTMKRTAPDGDNILKAVTDSLWEADAALGDKQVQRRWGWMDQLIVTIILNAAPVEVGAGVGTTGVRK